MKDEILKEFKINAIYRLQENLRMVKIALEKVSDEQLWLLPLSNGMSLGNQLLHSTGNMKQYIVSSLGELPDKRNREKEFSIKIKQSKTLLINILEDVVDQSVKVIESAAFPQFVRKRKVQSFIFSGTGVVLHAVEYFSYHTGQIAFWVKLLSGEDLDFYKGQNLNQIN
jgi:hypothetical protein